MFLLCIVATVFVGARENLNNRDGQTGITPVEKYLYMLSTKGVRCFPKC